MALEAIPKKINNQNVVSLRMQRLTRQKNFWIISPKRSEFRDICHSPRNDTVTNYVSFNAKTDTYSVPCFTIGGIVTK